MWKLSYFDYFMELEVGILFTEDVGQNSDERPPVQCSDVIDTTMGNVKPAVKNVNCKYVFEGWNQIIQNKHCTLPANE